MTLRDLWENSPNAINKPLAHIGGGLSVSRANAGELVRQKVGLTICCRDTRKYERKRILNLNETRKAELPEIQTVNSKVI